MVKFTIKIDLKKIDKNRIEKRAYADSDGNEVEQLIYSIDAVPLKETKQVAQGDTWRLKKTHFLVNTPTKEEKDNKTKSPFLGDILIFEDK